MEYSAIVFSSTQPIKIDKLAVLLNVTLNRLMYCISKYKPMNVRGENPLLKKLLLGVESMIN